MGTNEGQPLKISTKVAYAFGQVTDSIGYNVFFFFFLFFLTDIVGIPPAQAGTISLIAILWDAVADLFVGQYSDNLKSKYGRRRPMMIAGLVPYAIFTVLMFTKINTIPSFAYAYYLIMTVAFWTFYKIFVIPFFSLGAELTDDFTERSSVRVYASIFLYIGVMIASGLPPLIVDWVEKSGGTASQGWQVVGLLFAVIILVTGFICWYFTRGTEKIGQYADTEGDNSGLLKNMKELLLLKATFTLVGSVFSWAVASSIISGAVIYLLKNNLGYTAGEQSTYLIFLSVIAIVYAPVINSLSKKFDKRMLYMTAIMVSSLNLLLFGFLGFSSTTTFVIYTLFYAFGNAVFWTIHYSMMYDISEVDEFVYGKRREGAITALVSFFQKLGAALATWSIGFMLSKVNYDPSTTGVNADSEQMILYLNTLIPALFGILAVVSIVAYPLNKSRFEALMAALKLKRANQPYNTTGFSKLLRVKKK